MELAELIAKAKEWSDHCARVNHLFKDEPLKTRQNIAFSQLDAFRLGKEDIYFLLDAGLIN